MNNVILSIIAKISAMDAESKQLAAQVEAQSLLISALMLAIGKEGGVADSLAVGKQALSFLGGRSLRVSWRGKSL